jgi:hypothetical protein
MLKMLLVGAGGLAAYRVFEAKKAGVPWEIMFYARNLTRPIEEIKADWVASFAPAYAPIVPGAIQAFTPTQAFSAAALASGPKYFRY